jgi:hypothetical protein
VRLRPTRHLQRCRRIALLALLALVCNQVAFAAHLCAGVLGAATAATATTPDQAFSHGCHAGAELPAAQDAGCVLHCAHPTDGNQQGKLPSVPFAAAPPAFALVRALVPDAGPAPRWIRDAAPPIDRRLVVFVSLQI